MQQRGIERVSQLLDAAAALIDEKGIDELTTSEVATRSGSSVGVVYRYFPNIQELLRALAARNLEKYTERVFETMTEEPTEWLAALDATIDAYIDLMRTEPGFRALRFGDVIAERFIEPTTSNNAILATAFSTLLVRKYGVAPSDDLVFDIEVAVEIADGLLHRAFRFDPRGEDRFIDRMRVIVREQLNAHRLGGRA